MTTLPTKCCEKCDAIGKRGTAKWVDCMHPYCPCHTSTPTEKSFDGMTQHIEGMKAPMQEDGLETRGLETNEEAVAIVKQMGKYRPTPEVKAGWEREFDEKFVRSDGLMDKYSWEGLTDEDYGPNTTAQAIKSIISRLLTEKAQEEREKEQKRYTETNIKLLVEKMNEEAEEYGQYHDDECPLMREDGGDFGDKCECEKISALKSFAHEWMSKVNRTWCTHLKEHRKYCRPEGNRNLTEIRDAVTGDKTSRKPLSDLRDRIGGK